MGSKNTLEMEVSSGRGFDLGYVSRELERQELTFVNREGNLGKRPGEIYTVKRSNVVNIIRNDKWGRGPNSQYFK